jgi:hypothetical protein
VEREKQEKGDRMLNPLSLSSPLPHPQLRYARSKFSIPYVFLPPLPPSSLLKKATLPDVNPAPGYLFNEIASELPFQFLASHSQLF